VEPAETAIQVADGADGNVSLANDPLLNSLARRALRSIRSRRSLFLHLRRDNTARKEEGESRGSKWHLASVVKPITYRRHPRQAERRANELFMNGGNKIGGLAC
jgi:hypothetical protein